MASNDTANDAPPPHISSTTMTSSSTDPAVTTSSTANNNTTTSSTTTNSAPSTTAAASTSTPRTLHIGTRTSTLALAQTTLFLNTLSTHHPQLATQTHATTTLGDKNLTVALPSFGAKALWTQELETMLLSGEIDVIVHSLKDMPTNLPPGCRLGAVLLRGECRDAVVMKPGNGFKGLGDLPSGAVVGTSSVRRSAQLKRHYPHLSFSSVRGNVGTRLGKLDAEEGEYACLVLAAAGLQRLGLEGRISQLLDSKTGGGGTLYAVGQGALGVEVREGDKWVDGLLEEVRAGERRTEWECLAERALLRRLEGGCSVPIGVETAWVGEEKGDGEGKLAMKAVVVSLDGKEAVDVEMQGAVGNEKDAEAFGLVVAEELVRKGAGRILDAINATRAPVA